MSGDASQFRMHRSVASRVVTAARHAPCPTTTRHLTKAAKLYHTNFNPPIVDLKASGVRWLSLHSRAINRNLRLQIGLIHSSVQDRLSCNCRCVRVHSSVSNSNSQKLVLEGSPKSVLPILDKSLPIPDEKDLKDASHGTWKKFLDTADPYFKLMRMDKPIGTWLLFWPCSWSIGMAAVWGAAPPESVLYHLALFLAGSFVMRGAGCTINDLWDRDIDAKVERTRERPLVSGVLTERQALTLLAAQLSVGLAILLQLNWYSVVLGASSMVLVATYPLAKRVTDYPQLFLGATFNWGALLGWSAMLAELQPQVVVPLYVGALCWTVVYDTIYAHQDKLDDARIGIKSTALSFGARTKPLLAAYGAGALGGLAAAGHAAQLAAPYHAALALAAAHVARQIYTLRPDSPSDCADKFRSNSLVGLLVFAGVLAGGWGLYWERRAAASPSPSPAPAPAAAAAAAAAH